MEDYAASEDEFMGELRLLGAELLQTGGLEQLRCPHANVCIVYLSIDGGLIIYCKNLFLKLHK